MPLEHDPNPPRRWMPTMIETIFLSATALGILLMALPERSSGDDPRITAGLAETARRIGMMTFSEMCPDQPNDPPTCMTTGQFRLRRMVDGAVEISQMTGHGAEARDIKLMTIGPGTTGFQSDQHSVSADMKAAIIKAVLGKELPAFATRPY